MRIFCFLCARSFTAGDVPRYTKSAAHQDDALLEIVGPRGLSAVAARPTRATWCNRSVWMNKTTADAQMPGFADFSVSEADTVAAVSYFLRGMSGRGAVVLDLGAWWGPFSVFAASFGVGVVAVEPVPKAFDKLVANLAAQPAEQRERTVAVQAAIGDTMDPRAQHMTDSDTTVNVLCAAWLTPQVIDDLIQTQVQGYPRSFRESCFESDAERLEENTAVVSVLSIEDLVKEIPVLHSTVLVKIDIEGYEWVVVPALGRFLTRTRSAAIVSIHPSFLSNNEDGGHQEVLRLIRTILRIYPFVYLTSSSRSNRLGRLGAPEQVTEGELHSLKCHFFDGCQVIALWQEIDRKLWMASACYGVHGHGDFDRWDE